MIIINFDSLTLIQIMPACGIVTESHMQIY